MGYVPTDYKITVIVLSILLIVGGVILSLSIIGMLRARTCVLSARTCLMKAVLRLRIVRPD